MGINTQYYLTGLFENLRAGMTRAGQKVEPVAPAAKAAPYKPKPTPAVILQISAKANKDAGERGK